jgi:hypothetical protein
MAMTVLDVFDCNAEVVHAINWERIGMRNIFYVFIRKGERHYRDSIKSSKRTVDKDLR